MIRRVLALIIAFLLFETTSAVFAEGQETRARLDLLSETPQVSPITLTGGSTIHLSSPKYWAPVADEISDYLEDLHVGFERIFGDIPKMKTTVNLMEAEMFYRKTGAPRWTNAMYYKGEITVPLALNERIDYANLKRSMKHEYTHSVLHALSNGRCPGWLDEGIAQWAEGEINPALEPALKSWMRRNRAIPLSLLQGGFTKLEPMMVPPAYAQSLFATRSIVNTFGFDRISEYMSKLRKGKSKASAFREAFRLNENAFEDALERSMKRWSGHSHSSLEIDTFRGKELRFLEGHVRHQVSDRH